MLLIVHVNQASLIGLAGSNIALQCDAVCCSVLQCVAVCCSVLQCVAVCQASLMGLAGFNILEPPHVWLCVHRYMYVNRTLAFFMYVIVRGRPYIVHWRPLNLHTWICTHTIYVIVHWRLEQHMHVSVWYVHTRSVKRG